MKKITAVVAAGLVLSMSGMAMAGTDTGTFGVTASIAKACVVGTGGEMAFGSLALLDASTGKVVTTGNADAVGTFYTACTTGSTTVTYAFAGNAASGFALTGAGVTPDTIDYTLFANSDRSTTPLTRATAETSASFAGFAADGADHQLSVYGRIALASMVAKKVDTYSDTVTVTVSFD